jgi:hypothetical protein
MAYPNAGKQLERLRRCTPRVRIAIVGVYVAVALIFAGSALATTFYYVGNLGIGGYASTPGWNNRDYNRGCWDGTGTTKPMAVGYFNTSDPPIQTSYSGTVYTQCAAGLIARLENDGYYMARCYNNSGETIWVVCQTTP